MYPSVRRRFVRTLDLSSLQKRAREPQAGGVGGLLYEFTVAIGREVRIVCIRNWPDGRVYTGGMITLLWIVLRHSGATLVIA